MRLLLDLNTARELTLVIITHDRQVARQCVRNVRMQDGVLREFPVVSEGATTPALAPALS